MDQLSIETIDLLNETGTTLDEINITPVINIRTLPAFDRPLSPSVRDIALLKTAPWVRTLGKLAMDVSTHGWRFPTPEDIVNAPIPAKPETPKLDPAQPRPK